MKKFKKLAGIFSALLIALGGAVNFTACDDPNSGTQEYSISGTSEVTVGPGDEKTINVTTNGTMLSPVSSDSSVATATVDNDADTITITGSSSVTEKTTATITVTLSEDEEKTLEITVTVDPSEAAKYLLTITLDEEVAASASSVVITYAGKEDSEEEYDTYEATATVTEGTDNVTWTAELVESYANSSDWFNNISATVSDSEGNEIDVSVNPTYFCYTDTSFTGISISKKTSSETFKIVFDGFTIPGGSVEGVKYCNTWSSSSSDWAEDNITTPDVTVAEDGTYAEFEITSDSLTSKEEFYIDWTAVTIKDSEGNTIEITSGLTASNQWYSYADTSSLTITATYIDSSETYTEIVKEKSVEVEVDSTFTQVLEATSFADLSITKLKVTISSETTDAWCSISGADSWADGTYTSGAINTTTYITDSSYIEAIQTNGLYIQSTAGTFVVTVEYN